MERLHTDLLFGPSLPKTRASVPSCCLRTIERPPSVMVQPRKAIIQLKDLQEESRWCVELEPANVPTSESGNCQSIPHVAGRKRHWAEYTQSHAVKLAQFWERMAYVHMNAAYAPLIQGGKSTSLALCISKKSMSSSGTVMLLL